jgi:UDP-N-acetylglucosamine 4,6-dehydratase
MDWSHETVLITGGTGTFGQAMARYLLERGVGKLRILSRGEERQRQMAVQFGDFTKPGGPLTFGIGDVRDVQRLRMAFRGVSMVFHAAALKQIPVCEYSPFEAVQTNIIGTQNVLQAAMDCSVQKVILISSDKAAGGAVNLYGATKMCAERLTIAANAHAAGMRPRPIFGVVRYGNVVGSTGSVIHAFREQHKQGGVLYVTDPEMTRFWWTADQAVDFTARVASELKAGYIYIPKLPSVRIMDIAKAMYPSDTIRISGMRQGEKLHETLVSAEEMVRAIPGNCMWLIPPFADSDTGAKGLYVAYTSRDNDCWLTGEEAVRISGDFLSGVGE